LRVWTTRRESSSRALSRLAIVFVIAGIGLAVPAGANAQEDVDVDQLTEGQSLYLDNCSGCHQPSGVGLPPQFPPLLDNPHVDDSDYVRGVIMNGLSGEIEVLGQTYDGVMPSFPTLDDAQIDAIVAFVQNDLVVPGAGDGEGDVPDLAGPTAGTKLPPIASAMAQLGYVVFGVVVLAVLGPRIVAVIGNRGEVSGVDAGLKTASIVVYFVATTVLLPSLVLQTEVISRLPGGIQDFVALAIWLGALGIGILGLWWAQRQDRI
jgi:mono/diheme cytochrome c family protein